MTALDAPDPGEATRLLNPRRSAHATIRGYLYQTCLGVLRWLELKPNEILDETLLAPLLEALKAIQQPQSEE